MTLTQVRRLARQLVEAELCASGVMPGNVDGSFAWDVLGWTIALNNVDPTVARWYDRITENQKTLFIREWIGGICV